VRTLRRCKNIFLPDKSIKNPPEILNNNWYEMRIERDDKHLQDDILDLDLSTMSEEDARSLLLDSAKQYNMLHPTRRFVDPRSGTVIHAPLGACLINLTDRPCDLAPAFLEAVKETPEYDELLGRINTTDDLRVILDNDALTNDPRWESYEMKEFIHDLHDVLSKYAPEGYSFGVNCDKLKNYGYWKNDQ